MNKVEFFLKYDNTKLPNFIENLKAMHIKQIFLYRL